MPLILSGSVNVSGSIAAQTIIIQNGGGGIVSSSQQIQNYNTFAVTSSANTFYGNQTISGNITSQLSNTDVTFGDVPNAQLINTATATTNQYAGIRYRFQDGSLNGNSFIGALRNSSTSRAHSIIIAPSDAAGGNATQAIKINTTTTEITGSLNASGTFTSNVTSGIFLNNSSGGTNATQLRINNTSGDLRLGVESSAGGVIQIGTSPYAAVFGNQSNNPVHLTTNGTNRVTVTGGGQTQITGSLSIAGTNNETRFYLQNSDGASYLSFTEQEMRMWRVDGSGSDLTIATQAISGTLGSGAIVFKPANTLRMTIAANGNIGAPSGTNIYNASDARLKQNILSINGGLASVLALNPVKFNWIDGFEPSEDGKDMLGFVAQEVQAIVPEAVDSFAENSIFVGETEIDNPLRVNEKFLIPVLTKAIQEQQAIIDGLIARIEALESK